MKRRANNEGYLALLLCMRSALTGNNGCGHRWTERRRYDPSRARDDLAASLIDYLTTNCPNCGAVVAVAPAWRERVDL